MRVRLEGKAQEITLEGSLLGRGGEASIYAVPSRTDLAAKIYHNPLEEAEHELTTCAGSAQHVYHRGRDGCPWCVLAQQKGRDPFPDRSTNRYPLSALRPPSLARRKRNTESRKRR